MVFIKRVNNPLGDLGDSSHVGSDHWDWLDKYYDDTDIFSFTGKAARIRTVTEHRDQTLKILNAALTAGYTIKAGTISSNVDLSLPDLAASGTLVAAGGANDWGDAAQTFRSTFFIMRNPANSNSYIHTTSAIAGNRVVTWPLLTADDEVLFKNHAQQPTNKTYTIDQNTIKHSTTNANSDILIYKNSSGKYDRLARGTAGQIFTVAADGLSAGWETPSAGGGGSADKVKVYEGGTLVGTIARKLNFNSSHFNCTNDTVNDEIDIDLASPGGGGSGNTTTVSSNTTTVSVANTSSETNLLSQSISAGSMGTNGTLYIVCSGYYLNDSGSSESFTMRLKLGGTTLWEDDSVSFSDNTIRRPVHMEFWIKNMNSASAQRTTGTYMIGNPSDSPVGFSDFSVVTTFPHGTINGANTTINTASAQTLLITIQHSDTDALLSFNADILRVDLVV